MLPFVGRQAQPQGSTIASHQDTFDTPYSVGFRHTRRFTPAELLHCSTAAGLCVEQRHSSGRRLPVNQCGFKRFLTTRYLQTVTSSSYYKITCTEVVVYR